jgi:hypothetical protein
MPKPSQLALDGIAPNARLNSHISDDAVCSLGDSLFGIREFPVLIPSRHTAKLMSYSLSGDG